MRVAGPANGDGHDTPAPDGSTGRRALEAGFTLLEVMLASSLMLASMTIVGTTIEALVRHDTQVTNEVRALDGIQGAMEVATHDLHAGVAPSATTAAFTTATATTATFTAALGDANGPDKVTISVTGSGNNGTFTVTRTPATAGSAPNYTWTGRPFEQVTLGQVQTTGNPVLTYYGLSGQPLSAPVTELSSIAQVGVDLAVIVGGQRVELSYKVDVFNIVYAEGGTT